MIYGIDFSKLDNANKLCEKVADSCFENRLIIERAGRKDTVLKLLPALTIDNDVLIKVLNIIKEVIQTIF